MPLQEGAIEYPISTDLLDCPKCHEKINLKQIRNKIEMDFGKKVIN